MIAEQLVLFRLGHLLDFLPFLGELDRFDLGQFLGWRPERPDERTMVASLARGEIAMGADLSTSETSQIVEILNRILELELAGLVRYLHFSFMIFGHTRIPIVAWLRGQASEAQAHAVLAGEHITSLGGHPSLKIGALLETHKHNVDEILREAQAHEQEGLAKYRELNDVVAGRNIMLEEYARNQIAAEEAHLAEIAKMLRKPGSIV